MEDGLQGCFHASLRSVDPEDTQRLAFQLTDGHYHVGMFGWTGMSGAFQVVTRVLKRLVQSRIFEDLKSDFLGDGERASYGLLGPNAVENTKTHRCRETLELDRLSFDLDLRSVSLDRHNFLKTLQGFMAIDEFTPVSSREVQKLAS